MTNNPGEDRLRVAPKAGVHAGFISPRNAVTSTRKQQVDSHLVGLVDPDSYEAEQYRKLRYTLEELHKPGESLVVGICSPVAADGKSLTALNLAGTLAQDPSVRVLLVDVDLRRKSDSLKDRLPLKYIEGPGLIDLILDPALSLHDVVRSIPLFNMSVVTTGIRTAAPYESLRSPRFSQFIAEARKYYDYVILDAPPVVPVSDCRIMARWVDGFLMVVAAHRTPRTLLEEALNLMRPEKMLGLVYNRGDLMPERYYGYYGYSRPTGGKRPVAAAVSGAALPARVAPHISAAPVKVRR